MRSDAENAPASLSPSPRERRLIENVLRMTLDEDYIEVEEFQTLMGWHRQEAEAALTAVTELPEGAALELSSRELMFLIGSFAEVLLGQPIAEFEVKVGGRDAVEALHRSLRELQAG